MKTLDLIDEVRAYAGLPWIGRGETSCFVDQLGSTWTPIGHNEGITWPNLAPLLADGDADTVEGHLEYLAGNGVTCLRLMLEYAESTDGYLERSAGRFAPAVVRFWDRLIELCESTGIRLLLTPYDTFWMWENWQAHPYNVKNGGPCSDRTRILVCPETRRAIKSRLAFASSRWGASGAIFAWDLWNELHPAFAGDDTGSLAELVSDLGGFLRQFETQRYGRAHLQTASIFGPLLDEGFLATRAEVRKIIKDDSLLGLAFRHPAADFLTVHIYAEGTIDDPENTVDAAIAMGRITADAVSRVLPERAFLDTESGPVHAFKDLGRMLPERFDDEYFRHMQWAHFASGGCGGGMRWPYRQPHCLTPGMHRAQAALARFLPLIDWQTLRRRSLNDVLRVPVGSIAPFGCGDDRQAVVWLLRRDALGANGAVEPAPAALKIEVGVPRLRAGWYRAIFWNTESGCRTGSLRVHSDGKELRIPVDAFTRDIALAVTPL